MDGASGAAITALSYNSGLIRDRQTAPATARAGRHKTPGNDRVPSGTGDSQRSSFPCRPRSAGCLSGGEIWTQSVLLHLLGSL